MSTTILVIDPLSSSEYLVNQFRQQNVDVIAFKTIDFCNGYAGYDHLPFKEILTSTNDLNQDIELIKNLIKKFDIRHGFTGVEANFNYAEKILSCCFPGSSNNIQTNHFRSDKFWMNEQLRKNKMDSFSQMIVPLNSSFHEKCNLTFDFFEKCNHNIVIKPNSGSAASVGVISPRTKEEIELYYQSEGEFLFKKTDYLIQEKLVGDEYYVDTASYKGIHYVTAVGKYCKNKTEGGFEYQYADNLDLNDFFSLEAARYVLDCLNLLGMQNGLSHTEIMYTANGFRLIELNPRISGLHGFHNYMAARRYGLDQVKAYLDLINNQSPVPNDFFNINQRVFIYKNKKGPYSSIDPRPFTRLKSYTAHKIIKEKSLDANTQKRKSLVDTVLVILLEHPDIRQIQKDTAELLFLEDKAECLIK